MFSAGASGGGFMSIGYDAKFFDLLYWSVETGEWAGPVEQPEARLAEGPEQEQKT